MQKRQLKTYATIVSKFNYIQLSVVLHARAIIGIKSFQKDIYLLDYVKTKQHLYFPTKVFPPLHNARFVEIDCS